jgi:hypothetical protein
MAESLEQEDKRPDPPVVAVLVPVVITMTAEQAKRYAADYEIGDAGVATDLIEVRDATEAVAEALGNDPWLGDGMSVTVFGAEVVPAGEPFPGFGDGYVTGLCGHRVARSEWAAGYRACEHCGGVTVNG